MFPFLSDVVLARELDGQPVAGGPLGHGGGAAARGRCRGRDGRGGRGRGRSRGRQGHGPGGPRGSGAGRKSGYAHTMFTRSRIAAGLQAAYKRRREREAQEVIDAVNPDDMVAISQTLVRGGDQETPLRTILLAGQAEIAPRVERRDRRVRGRKDIAVVSHISATARGTLQMFREGVDTHAVIASHVIDDASMWIQRPRTPEALVANLATAAAAAKLQKK